MGFLALAGMAMAETGVTDTTIKVGWIGGTSGPIAFVASNTRIGVEAHFKAINDAGGINGRKLELIAEDDAYQPVKTVAAYKKLVERDGVAFFCGNMGTVTTDAILSFLQDDKVPLVAPFGLSLAVTVPPKRYVFAALANYYDQLNVMADYIVTQLKGKRVVYLYQNDEAGQAGLAGLKDGLKRHGLEIALAVPFETATTDFSSIIIRARQAKPDVVQLLTVPVNSARILKEMAKFGWKPTVTGHAPIIDEQLLEIAGDAAEGVMAAGIATRHDADTPEVKEYRATLAKYFPGTRPTFWSLQGYNSGKVCVEGLRRAGKDLTREGLVNALETVKGLRTGLTGPITYGPGVRAGNRGVAVIQVKERKFVQISDWMSPK
jgi:ABC-type branched-subunit amino acid transport system substrate-binding protein